MWFAGVVVAGVLGGHGGGQLGSPYGCVRPSLGGVVHQQGRSTALECKAAAQGGSPRDRADWAYEQQASKLLLGAGLHGNLEHYVDHRCTMLYITSLDKFGKAHVSPTNYATFTLHECL